MFCFCLFLQGSVRHGFRNHISSSEVKMSCLIDYVWSKRKILFTDRRWHDTALQKPGRRFRFLINKAETTEYTDLGIDRGRTGLDHFVRGHFFGRDSARGSGDHTGVRPLVLGVWVHGCMSGLLFVLTHHKAREWQVFDCKAKHRYTSRSCKQDSDLCYR